MNRLPVVVLTAVLGACLVVRAQEPISPRAHFDAGRYQDAINAIAAQTGDANPQLAIAKATQAVALAPDQFHPNYQLGLAQSAAEQWEPAAAAFEKASSIDPASAYAHYFAGLAYSRLRQIDKMATHLEYFLKLAPNAPEQAAVMTLMRSVRGR